MADLAPAEAAKAQLSALQEALSTLSEPSERAAVRFLPARPAAPASQLQLPAQ